MKFHTEYLTFNTAKHREYVHITPQVEGALRKSGIKEGMVLVSAMHITAGVYVNDDESGLIEDIDQWLEELAPSRKEYKHHRTGEDNGDSAFEVASCSPRGDRARDERAARPWSVAASLLRGV
jgi:secondary thiamine-phosphate synthase enzyme